MVDVNDGTFHKSKQCISEGAGNLVHVGLRIVSKVSKFEPKRCLVWQLEGTENCTFPKRYIKVGG